jgi:hypothetical protein
MKSIEEYLSPQAKVWLERMSEREEKHPGRVLSAIIERYMELEDRQDVESVDRLVETLVHGPAQIIQALEDERAKVAAFTERANNTLQFIRLYCAQLHARRHMDENGHSRYTINPAIRRMLFVDEFEVEEEDGFEIR